jgi:Fe-S-cluster-containing hydrogenase component 2
MFTKEDLKSKKKTSAKTAWDILVIDPRRCIGCEICESVCSFAHDGEFNPINSRINRVRIEPVINSTINCLKCKDPDCVEACDLNALSQDPDTGLIIVDENACDGCGSCVKYCPYGAITIHSKTNKAIMCDLCEDNEYDEPQCVEYCPKGAIFVETIDGEKDEERLETLKRILERGFEGEGMLN